MTVRGEPTRPYTEVTIAPRGKGGWLVLLDGAVVQTPARAALVLPTQALAAAVAAEWQAQGTEIAPHTMPLTRLANVSTDLTPSHRDGLVETVVAYAGTDLLCHRAEAPEKLVALQAERWDPPLVWAKARGVELPVTIGIIAQAVPRASLDRVRALAIAEPDFTLTGLAHAVAVTGSAVLGLALAHRAGPSGRALFETVALDELWSIEQWGEDAELTARLDQLKRELTALEAWFAVLAP